MCGINVIVRKSIDTSFNLIECIKQMNSEIIHRGPDDCGYFVNNDNTLALGMQRLSIIDINSGKQPMHSEDDNTILVFNGEIYNYVELKLLLTNSYGIKFYTNSDTEVILRGYEVFKSEIFEKLNGMFAIAIYDKQKNAVIVARDRVGEKPLYYWENGSNFVFCSELKSLIKFWELNGIKKPKISVSGLNLFFQLTYIPTPFSIFEDVYKLDPGNFLEVSLKNSTFSKCCYWDIQNENNFKEKNYHEAKKKLRDLVYDSVEKRMISDVPYGAFLSGGVDSSIIVAVMSDLKPNDKIKTFSIVSNNKLFDESARSKSVSDHCKTEHYPILLDLNDIKNTIDEVVLNFDEPFADSSALPTYFVSKKTKEHVTVALTGDGGDELFGGYNRYKMSNYSNIYNKIIPSGIHQNLIRPLIKNYRLKEDNRGFIFQLKKFIDSVSESESENLINIMSLGFQREKLNELLLPKWQTNQLSDFFYDKLSYLKERTTLTKARFLDLKICLEGDMLVKVDRASMLNSVECRPPLLDHRIVEFSYQLPDNFLISNGITKKILKDTFKHLLPPSLFSLPKSGFGIPIGDWLRTDLKENLKKYSNIDFIKEQGIFNYEFVDKLIYEHIQGKQDSTFQVWSFYCFQVWYNKNIKNNEN